MRYIDAEELKKIKFHPLPYTHITPSDVDAESYKRGWNDVIDAIVDLQPTADVRENVRGEWLPMKRFGGEKGQTPDVMCSVCYAPALWLGTLGCIRSNYCPNCGADMRGDI